MIQSEEDEDIADQKEEESRRIIRRRRYSRIGGFWFMEASQLRINRIRGVATTSRDGRRQKTMSGSLVDFSGCRTYKKERRILVYRIIETATETSETIFLKVAKIQDRGMKMKILGALVNVINVERRQACDE